jgi:hypothetical protein
MGEVHLSLTIEKKRREDLKAERFKSCNLSGYCKGHKKAVP